MIVSSVIWIFLADMQGIEAVQSYSTLRTAILITGVLMVLLFHDMQQA